MLPRQQTHWQNIVVQRGHTDPEQSNNGLQQRLVAKIHLLEEQNHGLHDSQQKLRGEIHTLNSDLADMREEKQRLKLMGEREEKINLTIQKKTEQLAMQLKESKHRVEELERHLETKKFEVERQLLVYQEELKRMRISSEKQSAKFTEEKNRLEVEIYKKASELKHAKEELEKLKSDLKLAQKKLNRVESSRDEVLQQNENLHDEMFRLEHEYKSMLGNKANLEWELINMQKERVVNSAPVFNASTDSGVSQDIIHRLSLHCAATSPPRYAESIDSTTDAFSVPGDQELCRSCDGVTDDGVVYSIYGFEGDVIIFLTDIGVSSKCWHEAIGGLQNSYRCVTYDLAGIGDSEESFSFFMSTHVQHLRSILFDMKQCTEVHLIGWGWGALVAIEFSMSHPDQCISAVSINAPMQRYGLISSYLHLAASVDISSLRSHWKQCQFTNTFLMERTNSESHRCDIDGVIPPISKIRRFLNLLRFLLLRLQEHVIVFYCSRELFIPNKHLRHFVRILFHAFLLSRRRVYYKSYSPALPLPGDLAIGSLLSKKSYRFIYLCFAFSWIKLFHTNPTIRETPTKFLLIHSSACSDGPLLFKKLRNFDNEVQCAELHGRHACFFESGDRFLYLVNAHLARNAKCSSR